VVKNLIEVASLMLRIGLFYLFEQKKKKKKKKKKKRVI